MTSIIVGQNISGSLTSTSPTIVDPTSLFNGQFYDDFDVSSVNIIDPSNLPFLQAASNELGNIGSVKVGEVRSTNIFIQPPAGSAPGATTTIQLINTKTNSVDAQATSSGSAALQFVKNAEIAGTDYKVRIINATPGDYQISLAGAIQAVQVVGTTGTNTVDGVAPTSTIIDPVNPNIARNSIDGLIYDSTGAVIGAARGIPVIQPPATDSPVSIDPPSAPPILTLPDGTVLSEQIPIVGDNPKSFTDVDPTLFARNEVDQPLFARNFASPTPPTPIDLTNPISDNPALPIPLIDAVFSEAPTPTAIVDPTVGSETIPTRGENPLPNERGGVQTVTGSDSTATNLTTEELPVVLFDATTEEVPLLPVETLSETDPRIFQSTAPTPEIAFASGGSGPISTFSNIVLTNNFLTTTAATGFGISAVSQKAGGKVSEIGIFAVDDATGKIGGIAPGAAGYLQAIGNSARSIFSTLGGSFFDSSSKREIALDPNKIYGFFQVQDGSIADLKQQLLGGQVPTNILSSLANDKGNVPIKVTSNSTTGGYNVSVNNDELVLSVVKLDGATPNVAIGAKSQGLAEGRTIDLTGLTGTLKVDITTKSSAAYNNNIGFYKVEDSIGTIKLADGTTVKPGDVNYAVEAIKSALTNSLQAGKTDSKLGQDIAGGKIYAPVVVAQGSLSDFLATNPTNIGGGSINAYFNYVPANADKKDHFRLIGNNTFCVEDQFGGGDRDFNDLVVNMNVKPA